MLSEPPANVDIPLITHTVSSSWPAATGAAANRTLDGNDIIVNSVSETVRFGRPRYAPLAVHFSKLAKLVGNGTNKVISGYRKNKNENVRCG